LREDAPGMLKDRKVRVVALVDDYLGYIDTPERVRERQGEGRRAWFGPGLMEALGRGLQVAVGSQRAP
jgi:neutral ceramidase